MDTTMYEEMFNRFVHKIPTHHYFDLYFVLLNMQDDIQHMTIGSHLPPTEVNVQTHQPVSVTDSNVSASLISQSSVDTGVFVGSPGPRSPRTPDLRSPRSPRSPMLRDRYSELILSFSSSDEDFSFNC